jgi:hypothetical protein
VADPGDGYLVEPLLQDRLGRMLTIVLKLINLPGCVVPPLLQDMLGRILAIFIHLPCGDGCVVPPLLQNRFGRILATLLQLVIHLPGGRTRRWLRCYTIAAEQVWKNIGNPLATGYSLAWWQNPEMVALFHHCCRTGWDKYWQPSCNWLFTCLVTEPGAGFVVPPLLQDRFGRILATLLQL